MARNKARRLPAAFFAPLLLLATPANAALIWDGDASRGTGIFGNLNCDSPGSVTAVDDPAQGRVWRYRKPSGSNRCENHGISVNGSRYEFQANQTYYFGWRSRLSNTVNNNANFQWKSYGNHIQNFPVLLKMVSGRMTLQYRAPGENCCRTLWSRPITANAWHDYALGLHLSGSASSGWIEFWFDGQQQTLSNGLTRYPGRTLDDINEPKWGVYGAESSSVDNFVDALKVGTTYADVAPGGTTPVGPPGYTFCANEGGVCSFTGNASVAYGANGSFNFLTASGSIACNSATFGDPAPGVAKACYFQPLANTGVEAERGVLSGAARVISKTFMSGGQGVGFLGNGSANWVRLDNINAPTAGNYTMTIHYVSGSTRNLFWSVNGEPSASATGLSSGDWNTLATHRATVALRAGANSIRFFNDTAYAPDLDRVTFEFQPPPAEPVEVTPPASAVTASANDGNVPGNTVDNNLSTRWSALGDNQWIRFDLGTMRTITHVRIAFYSGDTRRSSFDLQLSDDGSTWRNAFATRQQSSGTTLAEETFDFDDQRARYVRYLGHGNTANMWNSLTEVSIFALP